MMNSDSAARFGGLIIDGVDGKPAPKATPAPVTAPAAVTLAAAAVLTAPAAPAPRAGTEGKGTAGPVDTEGRARAIASDAVAAKHGLIAREPTLFTWGTNGQWGNAAYKARQELRARPLLSDFAGEVRARVAAEGRRADKVALPTLVYGVDGRLRTPTGIEKGSPGAVMTAHSFRQLLNRAGAPGYAAGYLGSDELPGELRAPHVQHWIKRATEANTKTKTVDDVRGVLLSKRIDPAGAPGHHVYGVVSEDYARYDMDRVVADVVAACPGTARGSLRYDATTTRWSMDATIGADFEPVVGDIHRVVLRIGGHDAGGGSISVQLFAERVRCLNFSKVHLSSKVKGRIRHVGSRVGAQVRALLDVQGEALKDFADAWRDANQEGIIRDVELREQGDARKVFAALIAAGHIDAPEGEDIAVERFFTAWLKEPGYNRADFVNAVTRAAHESPWSNPWAAEALEEQAGELLYNRLTLAPSQIAA